MHRIDGEFQFCTYGGSYLLRAYSGVLVEVFVSHAT